jgi:DNA-binding transcriptional regulator YdaS (Cro superfamily)
MEPELTTPLQEACAAVNGSSRLAALLTERMKPIGRTVSKASISRWKKERVPAEVCPDIEALTGITCERLRPDVNWAVLRRRRKSDRPQE